MCACHFCKCIKHLISQCQMRIIQEAHENNYYMPPQMLRNHQTIPPAVVTEDSSLAAIFSFELEENEAMFNGAALDEKCPITAIYTEATENPALPAIKTYQLSWADDQKTGLPTVPTWTSKKRSK
ncbi:hypothetical protein G9A89_007623 [Geosiphon pyriformis]|nr:hypothetical protein G9A89_007623 [Geosiphon pyriformis]